MVSLADIQTAHERIKPYILHTPLMRAEALDDALGCRVYLKLECMQGTGSFKLRGAMNRMLSLTDAERARGVVCTSSGNHAQGIALAARMCGIDAVVVMPAGGNPVKREKARAYGATVVEVDKLIRERRAREIAQEAGRVMVHAFDDPWVKAGQGTLGLELILDEPALDAVVVPVGGGGLLSGITVAVKALKPRIRVYGVEHEVVARYERCRILGRAEDIESMGQTIADGVMGTHSDPACFELIQSRAVDGMLLTNDDAIRPALYALAAKGHVIAEPASAMTLAVAMTGKLPVSREDKVAFVLSGGNCDMKVIAEILADGARGA